jgi:8-oxo-dGTP diphosphatase
VGISEQNLHVIRAIHIIMSGEIIEGNLNLSHEHEGYAWVFFENLPEYELADWLHDFVTTQTSFKKDNNDNNDNQVASSVKPWLKSIQTSVDKTVDKIIKK